MQTSNYLCVVKHRFNPDVIWTQPPALSLCQEVAAGLLVETSASWHKAAFKNSIFCYLAAGYCKSTWCILQYILIHFPLLILVVIRSFNLTIMWLYSPHALSLNTQFYFIASALYLEWGGKFSFFFSFFMLKKSWWRHTLMVSEVCL